MNVNVMKPPEKIAAGVSFIEGITGLGAVALAIIALAGLYPEILAAIATIALGSALVFEAGTIGARFKALEEETLVQQHHQFHWSQRGGITNGFLAGAAGIVLGILSLLKIDANILMPVAVIVFGASLIMDSGVRTRLSALETEYFGTTGLSRDLVQESTSVTSGTEVFTGLAAVVLGVLAIIGIAPMVLTLVGLLSVGASILLVGAVVGGRMTKIIQE